MARRHITSANIPRPFHPAPEALSPFVSGLSKNHVYLTHIDSHPAAFKRKIFLVPVGLDLAILVAFLWWMIRVQGPWYLSLLVSSLGGVRNETTVVADEESWLSLAGIVGLRGLWFLLDLILAIFIWPWPFEFFLGLGQKDDDAPMGGASPTSWRRTVGFRDQEIVVRKSRAWDRRILFQKPSPLEGQKQKRHGRLDFLKNEGDGALARGELTNMVKSATAPRLVKEKTGYLTMDGLWDLSFSGMITAHELVDRNHLAIEAFTLVALVYHDHHGWLVMDLDGLGAGDTRLQEERRKDVFRFREALAAVEKEDLFYRWIELVQFESTRPEGFGKERQEAVAQQVRDMFSQQNIDFDEFWKGAVGRDSARGL